MGENEEVSLTEADIDSRIDEMLLQQMLDLFEPEDRSFIASLRKKGSRGKPTIIRGKKPSAADRKRRERQRKERERKRKLAQLAEKRRKERIAAAKRKQQQQQAEKRRKQAEQAKKAK